MSDREDYLRALLHCTRSPKAGNKTTSTKAARELLHIVSEDWPSGDPIPGEVVSFLAEAMRVAAAGGDANKAFGLKRTAGQRIDSLEQDINERWVAVEILWPVVIHRRAIAEAKEHAATIHDVDIRRIEQIWQKWRPADETMWVLGQSRRFLVAILAGKAGPADVLDMCLDAIGLIQSSTPDDEQMGLMRAFLESVNDLVAVGCALRGESSADYWRDIHMDSVIRIASEMK